MSVKRVCDGCGAEFEHGEDYFEVMVEGGGSPESWAMNDFHSRCRLLSDLVPDAVDDGAHKVTVTRKKWF